MVRAMEKAGKRAIRAIRIESPRVPVPTAADIVVRAEGRVEVAQAEADVQVVVEAGLPGPVDTEEVVPAVEAETEVVAPKVLQEVRNTIS